MYHHSSKSTASTSIGDMPRDSMSILGMSPMDSKLDSETPYPISIPEQGMLLNTAELELRSLKGSFPGGFLECRGSLSPKIRS